MLTGLATPKRKNQYFFILKQTFPQGFDPLPSGTTDDRVQYHLNLKEGTSLLFPLLFTLVSITALQPLLPPSDLWQLQKRGLEKKIKSTFLKRSETFYPSSAGIDPTSASERKDQRQALGQSCCSCSFYCPCSGFHSDEWWLSLCACVCLF